MRGYRIAHLVRIHIQSDQNEKKKEGEAYIVNQGQQFETLGSVLLSLGNIWIVTNFSAFTNSDSLGANDLVILLECLENGFIHPVAANVQPMTKGQIGKHGPLTENVIDVILWALRDLWIDIRQGTIDYKRFGAVKTDDVGISRENDIVMTP